MDRRAFIAGAAGGALAAGPALGRVSERGGVAGGGNVGRIATYVTNLRDHGGAVSPVGSRVEIVRVRDRSFDPNSIAVLSPEGRRFGYLPAAHGRVLAPLLDAGLRFEAQVSASREGYDPLLALELSLASGVPLTKMETKA